MTGTDNKNKTSSHGFTLVEVLVAIGIFSVVMLVIVSLFANYAFSQRRNIGEQEIQEDMRLALELFNREARIGFGDTLSTTDNGAGLVFRNQNQACVRYRLTSDGALARSEADVDPESDCADPALYTSEIPLTTEKTVITVVRFQPEPAGTEGQVLTSQGYVTVTIAAHAEAKEEPLLEIQSTVATRQTQPFNLEL